MLSDKERQWVATHGSPQARSLVDRYDQRPRSRFGFFRGAFTLVLLLICFSILPLAILLQGRFHMLRHLTGTWVGQLRSERPDDPLPASSALSERTQQLEAEHRQAQQQIYNSSARDVLFEVHRDFWHLAAARLSGTVTICDAGGRRAQYSFATTDLGDNFLRFPLRDDSGSPNREVNVVLQGTSLHMALQGDGPVIQGDLERNSPGTPQSKCGQ